MKQHEEIIIIHCYFLIATVFKKELYRKTDSTTQRSSKLFKTGNQYTVARDHCPLPTFKFSCSKSKTLGGIYVITYIHLFFLCSYKKCMKENHRTHLKQKIINNQFKKNCDPLLHFHNHILAEFTNIC